MQIIKEALTALDYMDSDILVEDYYSWAKKNYAAQFGDASGKPKKVVDKILAELARLDPTVDSDASDESILKAPQPGPYMQWIIREMKRTSYEELSAHSHEYRDQLNAFDDLKKRNRLPADKRDIMRYRTLEDLIAMLNSLGGADADTGGHSDFKQDIHNVRECICRLCSLSDSNIPADIQHPDDVLKFIGGNSEWEIWEAQNYWGTMILDKWGKGAGWCVGGMLGSRTGMEQLSVAKQYYPKYLAPNAHYVCFQRKNKTAERPTNKYLITLGENGSLPNNGSPGYQFKDADNTTQTVGGNNWGDDFQESQIAALAKFLEDNGLVDAFKSSQYKDCACFLIQENNERLSKGEPYRYAGGPIPSIYADKIKKIVFVDASGKDRVVDVKEHPQVMQTKSLDEMTAMCDLLDGKPYVYRGGDRRNSNKVPEFLREMVREVVIPEDYPTDIIVPSWGERREDVWGIQRYAFRGCINMTRCVIPASLIEKGLVLGTGFFRIDGEQLPNIDICIKGSFTKRGVKIRCADEDKPWLNQHARHIS